MGKISLSFIFEDLEKIKLFVHVLIFLAKQSNTKKLLLIFSSEKLTVLVESPLIWIDLDIKSMTQTYNHLVEDEENDKLIFLECCAEQFSNLETYVGLNTVHLYVHLKKLGNFKVLEFMGLINDPRNTSGQNSITLNLAVGPLPPSQWSSINYQKKINYDSMTDMPNLATLRKYINIFHLFKTILITHDDSKLIFEAASDDIDSLLRSTFMLSNHEPGEKRTARVPTKVIHDFLRAITSMRFHDAEIKFLVKPRKSLQLTCKLLSKDIFFNYIIPDIDEYGDTDDDTEQDCDSSE